MVGLAGGILFCGLLSLGGTLPGNWVKAVINTDSKNLADFYGQIGLATFMQAAVAAIIVLCIKRLSVIHALFGAFVAGCVMAFGVVGFLLFLGGEVVFDLVPLIFFGTVYGGAFLAFPVSLAVSVIAKPFRHFLPRPSTKKD